MNVSGIRASVVVVIDGTAIYFPWPGGLPWPRTGDVVRLPKTKVADQPLTVSSIEWTVDVNGDEPSFIRIYTGPVSTELGNERW